MNVRPWLPPNHVWSPHFYCIHLSILFLFFIFVPVVKFIILFFFLIFFLLWFMFPNFFDFWEFEGKLKEYRRWYLYIYEIVCTVFIYYLFWLYLSMYIGLSLYTWNVNEVVYIIISHHMTKNSWLAEFGIGLDFSVTFVTSFICVFHFLLLYLLSWMWNYYFC